VSVAVGKTASLIATFGGSAGAPSIGQVVVDIATQRVFMTGAMQSLPVLQAVLSDHAILDSIGQHAMELLIDKSCAAVVRLAVTALVHRFELKRTMDFEEPGALSELDINGTYAQIDSEAARLTSLKGWLDTLSSVDPTGWVAVGAAFTQPSCSI